jgi:hypothetical protein
MKMIWRRKRISMKKEKQAMRRTVMVNRMKTGISLGTRNQRAAMRTQSEG